LKRVIFFRVAGRAVHLPKLLGALILLVAAMMVIQQAALMKEYWDSVKGYQGCLTKASERADIELCKDYLYRVTGFAVLPDEGQLTDSQKAVALLSPISNLFLWAAVFVGGLLVYRTGNLVIPIEETIQAVKERRKRR
jgi:hypothetical protein